VQHTLWTVVIPVKGTAAAKSRLGGSAELAQAIALDTVEAALGAAAVIVVTPFANAAAFEALGALVVADAGGGLSGAIETGIHAARLRTVDGPVAVLLGDLPALLSSELSAALAVASTRDRSFVPDSEGSGTSLIASTSTHAPAFGAISARRHRDNGYVELDVPADSGLRSDVDTPEQLHALAGRLGPRTRPLLP
jgi:2-phospho-L-lactate guanylyltransferase